MHLYESVYKMYKFTDDFAESNVKDNVYSTRKSSRARMSSDEDCVISKKNSKRSEDYREEENDDRCEVLDKNNSHFI